MDGCGVDKPLPEAPAAILHTSPHYTSLRVGAIGTRRVDFAVAKWDPFLGVSTPEDLALTRAIAETE
jgi:hypothetical protein